MKALHVVRMGLGAAAIVQMTAGVARGETCARVEVIGQLSPPWASAAADLASEIATMGAGECRPMTLWIEAAGSGVRLTAVSRDGRRAERAVDSPDGLLATALGLLTTIPVQPATPDAEPAPAALRSRDPQDAAPPPRPPTTAPPPTASHGGAAESAPAVPPPPSLRALWAGLSTGVRVASPTGLTALDVEARADLLFERWLVLATLRSALLSCMANQGTDCNAYDDVSAGVGVGRRVAAGPASVDVAFEPSLAVMHMEFDSAESETLSVEGTRVALRLDATARLNVPVGRGWALTLTVDGDVSPGYLDKTTRLTSLPGTGEVPPPFPVWSGGVRLGASGAIL